MRQNVYKLFWIWDFEKEEKWLNEMAAKGLVLAAIGFCKYTFEDAEPGEYTIRLEMLEHSPAHLESRQYISFIEETGAEHIGSLLRWVYFRSKKENGPFAIYSDHASRIRHLNRMLVLIGVLGIVELINGVNTLWNTYRVLGESSGLVIGCIALGLAILLGYGYLKIYKMKRKLIKEKQLFE